MDLSRDPLPQSTFRVAVAAGVAVATVLYVAATVIGGSYGTAFFAIPVVVGFTSGALRPFAPYRTSTYALLVALLLSILSLQEGVVCVLFSLPVLLPLLFAGAFAGSVFAHRARNRRLARSGIGLFLVVGLAWQLAAGLTDDPRRHPLHTAEAEVTVDAPPEAVFELLTAHEVRVPHRWPWFLRIGLPMPDRMVVETPGIGGRVRFDFSQGTAFARIVGWDAPRELRYAVDGYEIHDLPFHVTRLGRSPDYGFRAERVEDWLTVEDTRYTLSPGERGRTVLQRRIVWRRHLAPDLYFGWLQQAVMERGQVRLLELLAERAAASRPRGPSLPGPFRVSSAAAAD